jgi:hypothetical protein
MGVFQNRVLKKIFWPRTGETNGFGRRLHNADLHELHSSSSDQTKTDETGRASEAYVWEEAQIQGFGGEIRGKEITCKIREYKG